LDAQKASCWRCMCGMGPRVVVNVVACGAFAMQFAAHCNATV